MSVPTRLIILAFSALPSTSNARRAKPFTAAVPAFDAHPLVEVRQDVRSNPVQGLTTFLLAFNSAFAWPASFTQKNHMRLSGQVPSNPTVHGARIAAHGKMGAADDPVIVLDAFAARNFIEPGKAAEGRAFINFDKEEFAKRVNSYYMEQVAAGKEPLQAGYAPFCKHIFMPNFVPGLLDGVLAVNEETQKLLQSEYIARTEKELPVLTRWFPKVAVADRMKEATYLDVILYSREQIRKENAAMGNPDVSDAAWGIVSVKPQSIDTEIPMEPITMMRNALGSDQGGSGVDLDRDAYSRSVEFWEKHGRVQ